MVGKNCKLLAEVIKVTTVMKETVSCVLKSVKDFAGVRGLKEVLKQVDRLRDRFDQEERDALQTMITANLQIDLAVQFARVAVCTCKLIAEKVCRVIAAEKGKISNNFELAIHLYVQGIEELMPQLEKARDELAHSQVGLKKAIGGIEILKGWCNRKISEMKGKAKSEVEKERAIAYGGAAGATTGTALTVAGVVAATNWWNPVGWVAGAVVIGGAAAVAGGVAVGVTEGITVPDLEKEYSRGITSLNDAIKLLEDMSKNTEESVVELDKKRKQMTEFAAVAQQSAPNGKMSITVDVDGVMFNIFKEDVFNLDKLCDDYLNSPDMPKDH